MGKRKRRLNSRKFAKKYASVRSARQRLRGVIEEAEADGIITEEEAEQIKQAKEAVVEAVVTTAVEEIAEKVAEVVEEVEEIVKPKAKKVTKRKMPIKPRGSKRKKPPVKKGT